MSDQFKTIEYGHVAYQNKKNEAYNNMLVNILPLHTLDHWGAVKRPYIFFSFKLDMLYIKLKGRKCKTAYQQKFDFVHIKLVQISIIILIEVSMLHS